MSKRTILVWFRNDLRVRDNEILYQAAQRADEVVPVYCFDPRHYAEAPYGGQKTGVNRARFILESVTNLKENLQALGGDLLTVYGYPEILIPKIADEYEVDEVYHHREVAVEETQLSMLVEEALWKQKLNLKHFIGHTLYHKEDLPFPIKDIPDAFASFRKKTERESIIRPSFPTPSTVNVPENLEHSELPSLADLLYTEHEIAVSGSDFIGGETEALKRMDSYFTGASLPDGAPMGDSSLLSPWLAMGCLSPHTLYFAIRAAEARGLAKPLSNQMLMGLWWRDYYRFMFKKHGNRFFTETGFSTQMPPVADNAGESFERWKEGATGDSLVDAGMLQLNRTGYMPQKMREICASYLIFELKVSWLWGAAYFEEMLIDYAPASNYGNWAHVAGVGSSLRDNKQTDLKKLRAGFDPKGNYEKYWLNTREKNGHHFAPHSQG
ncbi:deoxyribodipyrimidine photo-lyase [bacterium A37T11]|nr:deoxyribodipyrimidine photo-lyase [bacterium A37T11]